MRHPLRSLATLSLLTLGACGSGASTEAVGAPESVPFVTTSTFTSSSSAPVTAPPSTAALVPAAEPGDTAVGGTGDPAGLDPGAGNEMSAALITSLLSTEDGRAMVAEMMAQETGITEDQAVCFLENVASDTMLALSELGASGATPDPLTLPPGALDDLMGAVSTCGISPDSLLG
ncbi:MAG: hypothetical protein OEY70_19295 [Acidimicrobiia bacterium]|nr:hypothetical protein [Acidimicrobiia bacterium]